jgi:hypothetical protein
MIAHQHVGMQTDRVAVDHLGELFEKLSVIAFVEENQFAFVAPGGDVTCTSRPAVPGAGIVACARDCAVPARASSRL